MFRLPRKQMLSATVSSMNDIHTKICAYLTEAGDIADLDQYMLNYSTFIKQNSVRSDDDERGTTREKYITTIAAEFMDKVSEISDAMHEIQQAVNNRKTDTQCECGGYILNTSGHDVCEKCGNCVQRGDDSISAVPFGIVVESSRYPYRRQHHFVEWINQIQGRESTHIDEADLALIKKQMKKERIDPKTMDQRRLRAVLRTLRMQRLYEHTAYLVHLLEGAAPPQLSHELEQLFRAMFAKIQAPFERHVKIISPERKNFLSYSYVLAQFCKIVNRPDLLTYFSQLKSRDKLLVQDRIWKCICNDPDVQWPYYPSC